MLVRCWWNETWFQVWKQDERWGGDGYNCLDYAEEVQQKSKGREKTRSTINSRKKIKIDKKPGALSMPLEPEVPPQKHTVVHTTERLSPTMKAQIFSLFPNLKCIKFPEDIVPSVEVSSLITTSTSFSSRMQSLILTKVGHHETYVALV